MAERHLHDGRSDGLVPLESLDLGQVHSFSDLLDAMSRTAFSGRQLGEAFQVLRTMVGDPDCHVVLTLSGAMTVAKQGRLVCELIDRGMVSTIISTGALIAHGVTESIGLTHYRYDPTKSDTDLFHQGYNRIYDTLEMEANLNSVERLVSSVLDRMHQSEPQWCSSSFCREIGRKLHELAEGPGILRSAFEHNVPVYIPAFTDSEMGLDVSTWAMRAVVAKATREGREPKSLTMDELFSQVPPYNPFLDLQDYAHRIGTAKRLGILTIGGGVPRNWAQQVGPYFDITNHRLGTEFPLPRFQYAVRICPEPVHWGGLSGCTYSEGVSWGKFVPPAEGGRFAEVYADATVALPLLVKALCESF